MCDLCSDDETVVADAIATSRLLAEQLGALATAYRQMADGTLDPHSPDAKAVGVVARDVVRELVADWV